MLPHAAIWLDDFITWFSQLWPDDTFFSYGFNVRALLAIFLVALVCGAIGSLVVANRMAFFSDALAHCAFAGVALGLLLAIMQGTDDPNFRRWITLIMVVFGVGIGLLIALVREKTNLASDTVIGVFFAGAMGLGGMFSSAARGKQYFQLESFMFGNPLSATSGDILWLLVLLPLTGLFLCRFYNSLVFASFNPSLARSRQVPVRLVQYLFIALLAIVVNLCIQVAGVLLINAFLIVPAATAANLSRNLRQIFWWSIGLSVGAGWLGQWLQWEVALHDQNAPNNPIRFGIGGCVVVVAVLAFALSMRLGPRWRGKQA